MSLGRLARTKHIVEVDGSRTSKGSQRFGRKYMIAIEISSFGGPEVLKPRNGKCRWRATARLLCGLKRRAWHGQIRYSDKESIRLRRARPTFRGSMPREVVHSVGAGVDTFKVGERVCAILSGGGYAEYCADAGLSGTADSGRLVRY